MLPKLAWLLLLACVSSQLLAATENLNPLKDNSIYSGSSYENNSCGAGPGLFSGRTDNADLRRALLKFDIAAVVPAGSTIDSVSLTLQVSRSQDSQDATMTLHPLTRDWGEGNVDCSTAGGGGEGLPAGSGDATWLDAEFGTTNWSSNGADFTLAASGTAAVPAGNNTLGTWDSVAAGNSAMVSDVQSWLDNPATNHGWIVVGDETRNKSARRFDSREGAPQPVLEVNFTTAGNLFACCFSNGDCSLAETATCSGQGGTPDTNVTSCSPNPCPQPSGACCNSDQTCSDGVARDTCETAGGVFNGGGSLCSTSDCGLDPFVDALPIPGVLAPIGTRADGVPQYEMAVSQVQQQLHRDLPLTDVYGYAGLYPGPTIEAQSGTPVEVKYINNLPAGSHYLEVDECAHGPNYFGDAPRIVTHLHG
ncbi:MAG: DNRLRE domain-containing protein, partial [Pseudomonadales bacterium]|nr:DNRLRE domain-containing protein [Pseudomonadales bacterium]